MSSLRGRARLQRAAPIPVRPRAHPAARERGFVAADLSLPAAVTVPHVLVVGWLDRRPALPG